MPHHVSKFPEGIRELLGGRGPPGPFAFRDDLLTPVIDIEKYFHLAQRMIVATSAGMAAIGKSQDIDPKEGEIWWIHHLNVHTDIINADQAISFLPEMILQGRSLYGPRVEVAALNRGAAIWDMGVVPYLFFRFGDSFRADIDTITVGAKGTVTVRVHGLISRID